MNRIITGEWNGETISRPETAEDRLSDLININMSKIKDYKETKQEEFNDIESSYRKEKTLSEIKTEMAEIAGEWNGDEAGLQEDRANIAEEVITKLNEIEELLEEL